MQKLLSSKNSHERLPKLLLTFLMLLTVGAPGCALVVMGAKTLLGDPEVTSPFKLRTNIDLTEGEKTVLVLCTIPEFLREEFPALDRELEERINRKLKRNDIKLVPSKDVNKWYSTMGGVWDDIEEVSTAFDTDFIIHYDVERASIHEEGSKNMFRGAYKGQATGYEVRKGDGSTLRTAFRIFHHEFKSKYPRHAPIPADQIQDRIFREKFIARMSDELARVLYDHPAGDDVY